MWFKKKKHTITTFDVPYIKDGKMMIQSVKISGKEYIRIDHLIYWLKNSQQNDPENSDMYHYFIKQLIKVKNQ
jgi:hypothetical protein